MSDDAKLPQVNARQVLRALERAGFVVARKSGSHIQLKKPGHRYLVTLAEHGATSIPQGTLRAIIRGSGLSKAEFIELLD